MKIIQIIKFVYILNFIYFVKSSVYSENKDDFNKICNAALNALGSQNIDKFLTEFITKIESRLDSLINEKIIKLEEKLNKKITSLINDNMMKLEHTIQQMNHFNQLMLKMDHLTIRHMENEIELVNHKYKCSNISIPRSCDYLKGCDNNNYNLMLPEISPKPFLAACDLETLNGGWTIIQRRQDGSENFYRTWSEYAEGFGNVNGEFFIGLEKLHALTTSGDPQELYIILEDFEGDRKYARYGEFEIDSESNGYMLTVGEYSGNAGDSLSNHNGMKFSTRDRDNDMHPDYNCAEGWKGAWWYRKCFNSNLNGQYYRGEKIKTQGGINWSDFGGVKSSLKFTQMMIRTKNN